MNRLSNIYVNKEQEILREAIMALTQTTGARFKVLGANIHESGKQIDAKISMRFRAGQQNFNVEVKGEVRAGILPQLLEQFSANKEQWLFVAQYIPGPTKDELRANGINYLEVAGNCYINTDQVFVFINDREVKQARQKGEGKLWTPSGLKLLFVLLQQTNITDFTYRKLSHSADIALGSIRPILEEMESEGWSQIENGSREIPAVLREKWGLRWAEMFPVILQPKLLLGKFRFLTPGAPWPRQLPEGMLWGGEPAGELYTGQLVPETFTLYTDRLSNEVVKHLRIVPDQQGNITVYKKFWKDTEGLEPVSGAVPPLLAYAELRNSNDSRCWEIAEKIKVQYVAR